MPSPDIRGGLRMPRPLYDALLTLADQSPLRLHMPGHKGHAGGVFSSVSRIDFTEITPTGNLYDGTPPIAPAEALCAQFAGARDALFLTCGSTQGIYAMLCAAAPPGSSFLMERACHKSVYHAAALLDLNPCYLENTVVPNTDLHAPITPAQLAEALSREPDICCVFLTSPSYYGLSADLEGLAGICHNHGIPLLVDQAHGAHFPAIRLPSAAACGADLSVVSTHKTWPALGSSAVMYLSDETEFSLSYMKSLCALFGTTSPSYPIMASIDYARADLDAVGGEQYRATAKQVRSLRSFLNSCTPFHALTEQDYPMLDPCRLTVDTLCAGISGFDAARMLEKEGVYMEMADERYLVAILTSSDTLPDFNRLQAALTSLVPMAAAGFPASPEALLPKLPSRRISLRAALLGSFRELPLSSAAGYTSAQLIAPYPPGIPIIAPGEEITEKHIAYLEKKGYNINEEVRIAQH